MGMPVRLVLYATGELQGRAAARAAFDRIAALENVMSDYRPDSEVRRLEMHPGEWIHASADLFAVMIRAVEIAQASDGAFDPTIGPLVAIWREARRSKQLPDPGLLERARARVGWRLLSFDARAQAIRLGTSGMRLDLGGIAKGYILQEALGTLRAHGVSRALLEAGGDVVVGQAPPGRRGWHIEVPLDDAEFMARASALTNAALSTSGPTAQFVEIEGTRYSHVVDPRTGLGLTNGFTAHVIAGDAATADALATALTILGAGARGTFLARFPGVVANSSRFQKVPEVPRGFQGYWVL
jgi:thiamine biosynthesis lipoprotein